LDRGDRESSTLSSVSAARWLPLCRREMAAAWSVTSGDLTTALRLLLTIHAVRATSLVYQTNSRRTESTTVTPSVLDT
jgi:hypothetical protein